MMSHAPRRQSSETAGPFSSHPQPRVAAASERHGIAFRAHSTPGPSPAKPDPPNGIAVRRRTSPGKNRSARHVAAETQLSRQAARRAGLLQHGGDPEPGRGGGEAAEPRAREPCRRTHAHRQPDQERARTPRHPRLRPTLCTAAQRLDRLPTPESEPVPPNTLAELRRERARLRLLTDRLADGPVVDDQHRAVLVTPRPQLEEQMRGVGQVAELVE